MPTLQLEKIRLSNEERNEAKFSQIDWENISLYQFVREFWPVIEPGKPFVDGKHIEAICFHLEAVTDGRITRLLVNMPPRHAKSSIISVLWRVWTWIKKPATRFLCASYALSLSIRDNVKCRRLILSNKFQEHYGHIFQMTRDQNAKIKFENDKRGYSQAVSVGSSATGEGGDILLIDDPHSIDEKRSDVTREASLDWFKDTWCTRLNDQRTGAMVVVGQRVHGQDLSGYILSGETGEHWVHLNLPTEFEPDNRCVTNADNFHWEDWRVLEGDLLWGERFPESVVERAKRRHGPQGFAALYQQRPQPLSGKTFDEGNERLFSIDREAGLYLLETPRGLKPVFIKDCWHFTTSDVAAKAKEQNDWTVFATWAVTPNLDILLVDLKRGHWPIPEQKEQGYKVFLEHNSDTYQCIYFEDVGYQSAIGQELIALGVPCLPFQPQGDKVLRAGAASIWQRLGKLYFVKFAAWLVEFRKEIYGFPKEPHDDQVDNVSMACLIVRKPAPLSENRRDEADAPPPAEETGGLIPITEPLDPAKRIDFEPLPIVEPTRIDPFAYAAQIYGEGW
jgi:predicted phage terminase large subunit-like protein